MAPTRLHKSLSIEVRLDDSGVWQIEFEHRLEGFGLGSYIEAGHSMLHSGREIAECVQTGLERWARHPWSLELQEAPQTD